MLGSPLKTYYLARAHVVIELILAMASAFFLGYVFHAWRWLVSGKASSRRQWKTPS